MNRSVGNRRPPPRRHWRRPRLPFRPIVGGFLLAAAVLTAAIAWLLASQLHAGATVAYVAGVNIATLIAYLYDKSVAGRMTSLYRVPETVLHLLALAGGTPAALAGQYVLRHKTRKPGFATWSWLIVAIHVVGLIAWAWLATGRR